MKSVGGTLKCLLKTGACLIEVATNTCSTVHSLCFCVTFYSYLGLFQNEQKWLTLQTTSTSLTIFVQNEQNRLKLQPFLSKRQFRLRSPTTFVQYGQKRLMNKIGAYIAGQCKSNQKTRRLMPSATFNEFSKR